MKKLFSIMLLGIFAISLSAQNPVKKCEKNCPRTECKQQCKDCKDCKDCKKDCKNCPKAKDCKKQCKKACKKTCKKTKK